MSDVLKNKMQIATLTRREIFGGGRLGIFVLTPETPNRWWFQAGQYTTLGLDAGEHGFVPRAYSIAGSPIDQGLEFYIALVDGGKLTPTLFQQELGARFHYLTPKGRFTLRHADKRTVIMVATGTGLAPFVAQIRSLWKLHQTGIPMDYRIVLIHGVSYGDEFGYRAELESYTQERAKGFDFQFVPCCSRPDPARGWTPATGIGRANEIVRFIFNQPLVPGRAVALPQGMDAALLRGAEPPTDIAWMACGNPGMIEDLHQPAKDLAIGSYLVEEFWKA